MRVLVACEESQTVCKAFRRRWHEAYSCDIVPCSGGHPYSKKTCLWLKNLPKLKPTNIVVPEKIHSACRTGGYSGNSWYVKDENGKILQWKDPRTAIARSKTFGGIAEAMAEQWG